MTPEKYVEKARQLRFLLERLKAITNRLESLPAPGTADSFSRRHMLAKLIRTTDHQLKSLTINFGHSEAGLDALAATTVAGCILDAQQVEFIRDQAADELAYKNFYGEAVTNDEIIQASALEIEEMLPFLTAMVDRCASLLTAEC